VSAAWSSGCLIVGCASIDGELVLITDDDRSRPTRRPVSLRLRHEGERAPVVAVGDGAAGFSSALIDVVPETKSAQRPKRVVLVPHGCALS